jgi:hypothetical protein
MTLAREETYSIDNANAFVVGEQPASAGKPSGPNAEEGHRLISAFVNVRQATLREAIIHFVSDLSKLHDDER